MPKSRTKDNGPSNAAATELRSYVERIARLEEEKAELTSDIKDVKNEAAGRGFDKKVLAQMVREYRMDSGEREKQREHEALCEIYRASLGMLDGTPLGDAARKKLAEPPKAPAEDGDEEDDEPDQTDIEGESPGFSAEELEAARERAREDARAGKKITDNPFVSGDPRRSIWDETWCLMTGSDGMDIPHAYRRSAPRKPAQGEPDKKAA